MHVCHGAVHLNRAYCMYYTHVVVHGVGKTPFNSMHLVSLEIALFTVE